MKFAEVLALLESGARVTVPLMEGCVAEVSTAGTGERALVLISPNGKRICPWAPNLDQMFSDGWGLLPSL